MGLMTPVWTDNSIITGRRYAKLGKVLSHNKKTHIIVMLYKYEKIKQEYIKSLSNNHCSDVAYVAGEKIVSRY